MRFFFLDELPTFDDFAYVLKVFGTLVSSVRTNAVYLFYLVGIILCDREKGFVLR